MQLRIFVLANDKLGRLLFVLTVREFNQILRRVAMDMLRCLGMQRVVRGVSTVNAMSQACLMLLAICQKSDKGHIHVLPSRVLSSWLPLNH